MWALSKRSLINFSLYKITYIIRYVYCICMLFFGDICLTSIFINSIWYMLFFLLVYSLYVVCTLSVVLLHWKNIDKHGYLVLVFPERWVSDRHFSTFVSLCRSSSVSYSHKMKSLSYIMCLLLSRIRVFSTVALYLC